jgi:hypothetical protein
MTIGHVLRALAATASFCASASNAATLVNGSLRGSLSVTVNEIGSFGPNTLYYGYSAPSAPLDLQTTAESKTLIRVQGYNDSGLGNGLCQSVTPTSAESTAQFLYRIDANHEIFSVPVSVSQTVEDIFLAPSALFNLKGSLLTQNYTITNTQSTSLTFEFIRYYDGDLVYSFGTEPGTADDDGGGRLFARGTELLFETSEATGSSRGLDTVGIYASGGTSTGYMVGAFDQVKGRVDGRLPLDNAVAGDGDDPDQIVDAGGGYDLALALSRSITIGAGETGTFTTGTFFVSTATPDGLASLLIPGSVPEPATWASMMIGLLTVGSAMRRRRAVLRTISGHPTNWATGYRDGDTKCS